MTRNLVAYMCLLAAGIFITSVGVVWVQNGPFVFAHFTWLEVAFGPIAVLVAIERIVRWLRRMWRD